MSHVPGNGLPPTYPAAPQKGWFGRNWLWFVPTIVLLPLCLCGGLCVGVPYFAMRGLAESGAYKIALETVQQNAEVKEALGEPIEAKLIPFGAEVDVGGGRKTANIGFQVQGPKGSAIVASTSSKEVGTEEWEITELIVTPMAQGVGPITIVGPAHGFDDSEMEAEESDIPPVDRPTEESETESPMVDEAPAEEAPAEEPAAEAQPE
ncbi:MAG: hypothetical protein JNG90_13860 [Planctomycetaceae bacterium]|nr:hypothetical protein [Planctomycetaceae bacterium]